MIKELFACFIPKSSVSEAYRMLRTNIIFSSIDKEISSIAITSTFLGEGKSTVASSLAITMTQLGKKVLIVDADLRKPRIHKKFEISNTIGLTNVIADQKDYKECIQKIKKIENLDILTSGSIPPNPSELLSSKKMDEFLSMVTKGYDFVFIDTPPVASFTDAVVLSTKVDGILMVVASSSIDIKAVQNAKGLLEKVRANILGIVLNKASRDTVGSYYPQYYSCYGNEGVYKSKLKKDNKV